MSRHLPAPDRFATRIAEVRQPDSFDLPCWRWDTPLPAKGGYGEFHADGAKWVAHRWAYTYHVADIPEGLQLDHLCRNRWCVNPWHVEPVTVRVNIQRGFEATKTHCKNGHEFTPENTHRPPNRQWHRVCIACRDAWRERRNHARRLARRNRTEAAA